MRGRVRSSGDGSSHTAHPKDLGVSHVTFAAPDLADVLSPGRGGSRSDWATARPGSEGDRRRDVEPDPWCRMCDAEGIVGDTVVCRLAHVSLA